MRILIVYASKYGFTKKIAELLKSKLNEDVDLINIKKDKNIKLESYNRIILGTSVYMGKARREMINFVKNNQRELLQKKYGIFLCCADKEMDGLKNSFDKEFIENSIAKNRLGFAINFDKMSFSDKTAARIIGRLRTNINERYDEEIENFVFKIMK